MRVHNLFFCGILITITAAVKSSDARGISYCDHFPESPYVCQPCIKKLNNESLSRCTCLYGEVIKKEPNLKCPFHKAKYLKWLDDNDMMEEYNKIAHPELEEQRQKSYNLPSSSSSSTTTSTSPTYHPVFQSLSSSTPAKKSSSEKAAYKEYKKRKKEQIKRTKSEKKDKRSSQEKSKSTPSSLRSSAERQVHFGIVPEEIGDHPRVMRRGAKSAQQQNLSSSKEEEEKEKVYEKQNYHSDDEQ